MKQKTEMKEKTGRIKPGKITSGSHKSYWIDSIPPLHFQPLKKNLQTEIVIVGGGIAGLSIAYRLCELKKKVVLIEDGFIGSGETGRTSAHVVTALDDRYFEIERIYGKAGATLAAESHRSAIDFIERAIRKEHIDCEFERVPGYLFLHPSDEKKNLKKEFEAARRAGLSVGMLREIPGITLRKKSSCIQFNNQAIFHPLKYIQGLAKAITRMGGEIFTETHAKEIDHTGIVTDERNHVEAKHVVVATNSPVNNKYVMHLKQFAYRTYVIGGLVKKNSIPNALWWDTGDHNVNSDIPPYHYVRLQAFNETHDLLICGGEDHPTGLSGTEKIPEEYRYGKLESWIATHFPVEEIIYRWSGQVMETMDALAFIGRNPVDKNNVYIVTGDSGNGLTHGTIAGILIPDLITGKENNWEKIYRPSRVKILKSGKMWLKEFGGGLIQYFKQAPKVKEVNALKALKRGKSMTVKIKKEKYGAYRDEKDILHLVAAECTHLKCIVKWNNDEKSWDCPCHGSRFTMDGKVLNGPAKEDLYYYRESAAGFFQKKKVMAK